MHSEMLTISPPEVLNQLLNVHLYSFIQYLQYARPYAPGDNSDQALATIQQIAADQQQLAERIVKHMQDRDTSPAGGGFPMEFTDTHDLSLDFLLIEAIAYQEQDIETIGQCVAQLRREPAAMALAEEALGMAKGHLLSLREISES